MAGQYTSCLSSWRHIYMRYTRANAADKRRTVIETMLNLNAPRLKQLLTLFLTAHSRERSIRIWVVVSGRKWVQPRSGRSLGNFSYTATPKLS